MKVLQVIPSLAEAHGGPSRALTLMERALAAQGVAVETATTDDDGPGRRNGRPAGRPLAENGAVRRYFPKRLEFYKISPGFARWVWRHAGDYDIVHIHALFSFTSVAAAWAARRAGVPYVVRPLGTLGRYGMGRRRPWLKRLSLAWLEGPILRHAAAVHFTSEAERQEAEALGVPMRGALVPLGIEPGPAADVAAMQARFPALREGRCVLFLSRLDPKKNLEGLLRAFSPPLRLGATHGPVIARSRAAGFSWKDVSASASSSVGRPVASMASARLRVSSLTPAPGPINNAVRRRSSSKLPNCSSAASG